MRSAWRKPYRSLTFAPKPSLTSRSACALTCTYKKNQYVGTAAGNVTRLNFIGFTSLHRVQRIIFDLFSTQLRHA